MTDKLALRTPTGLARPGYAKRVKVPAAHNPQGSRDTARNANAENTRRAYSSDWRIFEEWCAVNGDLVALPCTEQTLCDFNLARVEGGCSIRTVRRGMVSIRARQTLAGYPDPYGTYARSHWRGLRNDWYVNPVRAAPLYGQGMMAVIDLLPGRKLVDLRARALLLVGLCGAMRRSEIVGLRFEDIAFNDRGMLLTIRRSKTDQEGKGQVVPIGFNPEARYCPVLALKGWLFASRITSGPVFQSMRGRRLSGKPLTAWQIATLVQTLAARAGLEAPEGLRWSAHSLRAGFLTGGAENGVPLEQLMAVSRHKSREQAAGYIRKDSMNESQTDKMGLVP